MKYFVTVNGSTHEVSVVERLGRLRVSLGGEPLDLSYEEADQLGQVVLFSEGRSFGVSIEGDDTEVDVKLAGYLYDIQLEDERERAAHAAERAAGGGGGPVKSVMPGVVVSLFVDEGQAVEAGQPLLILEAMKMQNEIDAPLAGIVKAVHVAEGQAVAAGEKLVTLAAVPD
ncbi:MAG TPA: biotin/lipoyl-containing protein [Planctomycetota bacterium]|jgi:biotin carboxyl carrier protein|nr:biotin/lipoyl-containing protein [Planctomycetota bacterium]